MSEQPNHSRFKKLAPPWRTVIEVGFIMFLFYSNLLMGEFTHSGQGQRHDLLWAIHDIFTITNFTIGLLLAIIGHLVFDFFRKRL